jgi:hypothetical protein
MLDFPVAVCPAAFEARGVVWLESRVGSAVHLRERVADRVRGAAMVKTLLEGPEWGSRAERGDSPGAMSYSLR